MIFSGIFILEHIRKKGDYLDIDPVLTKTYTDIDPDATVV